MDIGPIVGIAFTLFCVLLGNMLEEGHMSALVGGPAALIVIGGTIGAVIVQFPFETLGSSMKLATQLFKKSTLDPRKLITEIVEYANRARRDGILALEKIAPAASDPFLSRALLMAVDGADSNAIRETMELVIGEEEEHSEDAAKVFEAGGGYAPTVGIIGAVLGLIHVMSNLSDINAVGHGIAAAFVATIYGVAVANVIFLPLAGRLKMRAKKIAKIKEMMLVGVLAIQEGTNPKLVQERLSGFLPAHDHKKEGAAGAAAPATA
jgi:chemotaxis protein MotA